MSLVMRFGITGDLAKVMTFRSLYRLEKRGLLQCPIVGVDRPATGLLINSCNARGSRSAALGRVWYNTIFERFAARLSYVHGDFAR